MYNFTTETQGLDTFLVHEISEETQLDTAGLGRLLNNILTAIDNMEDFMLDPGMLLLDRQYIFVNVGTLQTNLIYYPVLSDRHEFQLDNFIKSMIMNTEFDPNEQDNYVTMLISYLNCGEKLTIAEIKQYISLLLSSTNHKPQQQTTAAYASQQPFMNGSTAPCYEHGSAALYDTDTAAVWQYAAANGGTRGVCTCKWWICSS